MEKYTEIDKITLDDTPRIDRNLELLTWLYKKVKRGYFPWLEVSEMQALLEKIVLWYEFKYPSNRAFHRDDGDIVFYEDSLSEHMTTFALKNRLSKKEQVFLDCHYRMGTSKNIENHTLTVCLPDCTGTEHYLTAREKDGTIISGGEAFDSLKEQESLTLDLDSLHRALECSDLFDLTELERVVTTHELDIELREAFFKIVTLALRKSKTENETHASLRAKRWMDEIGEYIGYYDIARLETTVQKHDYRVDDREAKRLTAKIQSQTIANCLKDSPNS